MKPLRIGDTMNISKLTMIIVVFMVPIVSQGQVLSEEEMSQVWDNMSHEASSCASYYTIVANALRIAGEKESEQEYGDLLVVLIQMALEMAVEQGRSVEMAHKVVTARVDTENKLMAEAMDYNNANISVLNDYSYRCRNLLENPDAIFTEFFEEQLKKREAS